MHRRHLVQKHSSALVNSCKRSLTEVRRHHVVEDTKDCMSEVLGIGYNSPVCDDLVILVSLNESIYDTNY